jgi:serine-type D-Ala-D-Ala carboxypeptidase/endopeptidase (penicillin-binding protein 4)
VGRRGVFARGALALVAVAALVAAEAQPAAALTLQQRLGRALNVAGISSRSTGAYVFDLESGHAVFGRHRSRSLKPASNEKIVVAVAALQRLGPTYRIPTRVLGVGSKSGSTWQGRLVLKGFGDPSLTRGDVRALARRIRDLGIRRVTGRVIGDESYFDTRRVARGWKPSFYKTESPPLSALVVARAKADGRTVDNPARAAARAFKHALRKAGVRVARTSRVGTAPPDAPTLTRVVSPRVSRLVRHMDKTSDNFYAEMLLKHLGARIRGAGTTRAGCRVVRKMLRRRRVPMDGVRIVDGSGLSAYDRLTARAIVVLLRSAWRDPAVKWPFRASLPIAGVDGTLHDRMRTGPARGRVRAKTGTTDSASSLSGYVGRRFVFSILQNGNPIPWLTARRSQDRFAQILAGRL